jgi:hypothetical protein
MGSTNYMNNCCCHDKESSNSNNNEEFCALLCLCGNHFASMVRTSCVTFRWNILHIWKVLRDESLNRCLASRKGRIFQYLIQRTRSCAITQINVIGLSRLDLSAHVLCSISSHKYRSFIVFSRLNWISAFSPVVGPVDIPRLLYCSDQSGDISMLNRIVWDVDYRPLSVVKSIVIDIDSPCESGIGFWNY